MIPLRIRHARRNASGDRPQGRRGLIQEYSEAREQPLNDSLDNTNGTHRKDFIGLGAKVSFIEGMTPSLTE